MALSAFCLSGPLWAQQVPPGAIDPMAQPPAQGLPQPKEIIATTETIQDGKPTGQDPFAGIDPQSVIGADVRKMFATGDIDRSGTIDQVEWKNQGRTPQGFMMADADGNGQLTPAEVVKTLDLAMEEPDQSPD
jgi:hypothetical protein